MRSFVAIELRPELKTALEALIREVKAGARGTKWVDSRGMHLTLKFLGWISEDSVGPIKEGLRSVVGNREPFRLKLKCTGTFPPGWKKGTRVLWVGIEEDPGLMSLQKDVETVLENLDYPREVRPFHPHLTLGRVKTPEGLDRILDKLVKFRDAEFGEMPFSGVTLFQSVLTPSGAEYKPLAEVPFP